MGRAPRFETAVPLPDSPVPGRRRRPDALGLWFLGLGLLGLIRAWMRSTRHDGADIDTIALLWWAGSALVAMVGIVRLWRRRSGSDPG